MKTVLSIIVALFMWGSSPAHAAVSVVSGSVTSSLTGYPYNAPSPISTTITYTAGGGANTLLLVGTSAGGNSSLQATGVTFNGVGLTKVGWFFPSSSGIYGSMWYMVNPPSDTAHSLVVSWSATGTYLSEGITAVTLSGVNPVEPFHSAGPNFSGSGLNITTLPLTAPNGGMYVDVALIGQNTTATVGGEQIQLSQNATGIGSTHTIMSSFIPSTGEPHWLQWTAALSAGWVDIGVGINPSPAP